MSTPSPILGLTLPDLQDRFSTQEVRDNWETIDQSPGVFICTSQTRPGWGQQQAGRKIVETDTHLEWLWTGDSWIRISGGSGILRKGGGGYAVAERATDRNTRSSTFVTVVTITNVVVPDGNRPLQLVATWSEAENSVGDQVMMAIMRSASNDVGPKLGKIVITPDNGYRGNGVSLVSYERDGLVAGTYDFSLQMRCRGGGQSTLRADSDQPIQLTVSEL